jgi:LuxR family maltose regulon positive regulatory protein
MGRVLEILLLQALAMQAQGDLKGAVAALTGCLALAHPEGYVRVFLDEGQPVRALLARWLPSADAGPLRDYAAHLLSRFDAGTEVVAAAPEKASPAGELVEPLSERELEVLRLMSLGRTNQQIAQQLVVARGTVKAHASHIYRKLDVANRTEAVTRARQLGLLP